MAEVCHELSRMVGVLVDRRGVVSHVILGDSAQLLYLPDIGRSRAGPGRLRGLRLLVAAPAGKKGPGKGALAVPHDLLTDLERLGLDLVGLFEVLPGGEPGRAAVAHVLPRADVAPDGVPVRHRTEQFRSVHDIPIEFDAFITELEAELTRRADRRKTAEEGTRDRAVLVGAYTTPRHVHLASMNELKELAKTAGVAVADTFIQRRSTLDARTIVGKGKLEEICLSALHQGADLLIFDRDLSPSQLNAITDLTDLRVLDRTMLILDIFARRAQSRGGRMQVELAQAKYSLPRLAKKQTGLSRLTGGIGGQGPGETKLEIDRRRVKDKIARLENEIEKLSRQRKLRRQRRNDRDVPVIAIVGYTNAGKSTLLNALTGAEVYAQDELFATLDPTSRRLRFPEEREVVLVDTVGFIRDLPPSLTNAFRATLEELHDADLLLHVVDIGDPRKTEHIKAVHGILEDLGLKEAPRLLVFNKRDTLDDETAENDAALYGALPISAHTRQGLGELLNACATALWQQHDLKDHEVWDKAALAAPPEAEPGTSPDSDQAAAG